MRFLLLIAILVVAFFLSEFLGMALLDTPADKSVQPTETPREPAQTEAESQSEVPPKAVAVRGVMKLSLKRDQIFLNEQAVSLSRFRRLAETAARDDILIEFEYDGTVTGSFVDDIKTILRNAETKNAGLE